MFRNILVPIDLHHENTWRKVLPLAVEQARSSGAQLFVMTAVPVLDLALPAVHLPKDYDKHLLEHARQGLATLVKEQVPDELAVNVIVKEGVPYREVLHAIEDNQVDLVVMASHTPEMKDYLVGSNAARVVLHANCSVMVVR